MARITPAQKPRGCASITRIAAASSVEGRTRGWKTFEFQPA
jgi:hypothetical protein